MPWQNAGVDIRERIRQALAAKPDLTVRGASIAAGMSDSTLNKFLNPEKAGGINSLMLDKLEKLADVLEVNPRWLIFGDKPRKRDPKIVNIWDKINERDRAQALRVLESFVEDQERGAG